MTRSNIETKMITGDSLYIAVETGRRAGIIGRGEKVVFLEGKNNALSGGEQANGNVENNRVFRGIIINDSIIENL